jgi:SAM-dependent methyltransferase
MSLKHFTCRSCGSLTGSEVLDLGLQPLANNLLPVPPEQAGEEPRFPLIVDVCNDCFLMQLRELVPPVRLFSEYLYFSSFSDAMLRHAREAVDRHSTEYALGSDSLVVEIASNDGYLLQYFNQRGIPSLGIEPAANIAKVAREKGIDTRVEFFSKALAEQLVAEGKKADLILGNNVFAHVPDVNDFVAGISTLLNSGGVAALEFPWGHEMVRQLEFDTIYHEHVYYFTAVALVPLFRRHGLEIFRIEKLPIHGGSLRIHASRAGERAVESSVHAIVEEETSAGATTAAYYEEFSRAVVHLKKDLLQLLVDLIGKGHSIAAYGASAKGSTLLNYCGIGRETLSFIVDRSTYKQGKFSPGMHLPILPPEALLEKRPDYTLLLTWNFADEILAQQKHYRDAGGRFIIPVPKPSVVG